MVKKTGTLNESVYASQPIRIEEVIDTLLIHHPKADTELVGKAYIFAAAAHQGMVRRSGEPYLNHPLAVAAILADMRLDADSLAAGLLHDTVEDTSVTIEDIKSHFGFSIASIVDGVTKISKMNFSSAAERKASNMRKMIMAMLTDLRVILVKLADRLNNMRTLGHMPKHKQIAISEETLEIFAPLASRLGVHKMQTELEDLALFYLEPTDYDEIRQGLAASRSDRADYVRDVIAYLHEQLAKFAIKVDIDGRSKHIYSIWKKMKRQNLPFEQIYDLTAFRIIVDSIQDCYTVLGVIHSIFKPIPGRFKDYISLPKANGYRSLHTSVIGPKNIRIEIQIKTMEMHQYAENGVAAHWLYKDGGEVSQTETQRITALRAILSWEEHLDNPSVYLNSVRDSLAESDSIYVFTPAGEVKALPVGASPVDFAYAIHTMVGHNCVAARVNGAMTSLRHKLKHGDMVEIITGYNGAPSRDWLSYAITQKAKARIRQWFAAEEKERAIAFGRELIEKEMRKHSLLREKINDPNILKELGYHDIDDLNAAVAFGRMPIKKIIYKLKPDFLKTQQIKDHKKPVIIEAEKKVIKKSSSDILISNNESLFIHLGNCCLPVPDEPIVGYLSEGSGMIIHSERCHSLAGLDPDRITEQVAWVAETSNLYKLYLIVDAKNSPGSLLKILKIITDNVDNILEAHAADSINGRLWFKIEIKHISQYQALKKALIALKGLVTSVKRFYPQAIE